MADLYETDARDQKAWRRVIAASRKLAKQIENPELGEAVANANHQDVSTRDMRRSEAIAALLEAVVEAVVTDKPEPKKKAEKSE